MKKTLINIIKSAMMLIILLFVGLMAQGVSAANFTTYFTTPANYIDDAEIEIVGGLASLKESSLWNGLQGYWKMDDASGQITDSSGNGNHLTNHNASYGASGKLNNAISFVEDNYLDGGGSMMNMGLNDMTISVWFKTIDNQGVLVAKTFYSGEDERYAFFLNNNNIIVLMDGGLNTVISTSATPYLDDNWHHTIAVFDRDDKVYLYVDGDLKSSGDISAYQNVDFDKNNLFLIGRYNNTAGDGVHNTFGRFSGEMDEIAIWNRVLTSTEITEIYNTGTGKELERYSNGTFSITKTAGNSAPSVSAFTNFVVTKGTVNGSLSYQLSTNGTDWKYWDGSAWSTATTQANSETVINANISSFPSVANAIYVKTFMTGDGTQAVEVDEINITYITNSTPTNIQIDGGNSDSVNEGINTGTNIATLTTTDPDTADTHTYTLVAGTGDEDNTKFQITGDQLQLNFTPDFENPTDLGDTVGNNTYSIRIESNDGNGGTYQKTFIITVNDLDENKPVITLIGPSNLNLNLGNTYIEQGATALDDIDGDISGNIVITGNVNTAVAGNYTINYDVSDSQGNQAITVTRTVIVNNSSSSTIRKSGSRRISKARLLEIFGKTKPDKEEKTEENKLCSSTQILHQNMKIGDRNGKYSSWQKGIITEVKTLQAHMNRLGFNSGPKDGILGPLTLGAIKRMQISLGFNGKLVDGYVGVLTRSKINKSC